MLSVKGLLLFMMKTAFIVAFTTPRSVIGFNGIKQHFRKAFYQKIDLVTQASCTQIIPGLYLGNAAAACNREVLQTLHITHVLTIELRRLPKSTFENNNISNLFIKAYDHPRTNLLPYFPLANAFIEEGMKTGNVLVHCHFGVSRSATLIIAYLMQKYQLTYDQAYCFVRQRRRFINPNPGFVEQLKEYERLKYDVSQFHRFEAFVNVNARKHKYKIASAAAVLVGIIVPLAIFI